jgi:hypothetical protein
MPLLSMNTTAAAGDGFEMLYDNTIRYPKQVTPKRPHSASDINVHN